MGNDTADPTGEESASASTRTSTRSSVFDALTDHRRRYLVHCLQTHDTPMALADVADEIAVWEHETTISHIPAEDVKRVYISLYHTHVPKLVEAGIVEYDQEQDAVALAKHADRLRTHLPSAEE